MIEASVTLQEVLIARERKSVRIKQLFVRYKVPIVAVKMNIPGPVKDHSLYRQGIEACLSAITDGLQMHQSSFIYKEVLHYPTGTELYLCINRDAKELKRIAVEIEEKHPIGRLFDIDVFEHEERSLSRNEMNLASRKCIICNDDAHQCGRTRKHSIEILVNTIKSRLVDYFGGGSIVPKL